jgi:hypothetical protein
MMLRHCLSKAQPDALTPSWVEAVGIDKYMSGYDVDVSDQARRAC